ncbi:MAG TPA: DUF4232 domain-containing protein [Gaiellaceae bacterium]|nr:DUF4232 domain-containing protein [Gaiellaceae bacterium]
MRLAALALIALALAAGSAGGTTSVPRCHTADLHVYLGRAGVAAGSWALDIAVRNRRGHACFVYGYPGLGLQDAHHRVMASRVTWGSSIARRDPGRHRVVLRPGRAAFASLSGSDVPFGNERCRPSAWLEVTPPDERSFRLVRFGATACNHGHLTVTALAATRTPHG